MKLKRGIVILLCGISFAVTASSACAVSISGSAEMVAKLTGPEAVNDTLKYRVYGTDLGHVFDFAGKLYFVFGDTFWKDNEEWRSNVMAVSSDYDFSDGVSFDYFITDAGSEKRNPPAMELIAEGEGDVTAIPTNGVAVGGKMYLYYMSVSKWGDPGVWSTSFSGAAVSEDGGRTWEKLESLVWGGESDFAQVAIAKAEDSEAYKENSFIKGTDIFFWGIPSGRMGPVKLMKVASEAIEDKRAYEYFTGIDENGGPIWSKEENRAIEVIEAPAGECSVMYNRYLGKWIFTTLSHKTYNLEIREAPAPWGPWSEPVMLVDHRQYPGLYGAYMHPAMVEDEGRIVYFTMSLWEPYNVYLMRVVLSR